MGSATSKRLGARIAIASALAALAGAPLQAHATATIDLIWQGSGTPETSAVSTTLVLDVIVTSGVQGVIAASVSVDYSDALETAIILGYASTPSGNLPFVLPGTIDSGTQINSINSVCGAPCIGLRSAGETHRLGTVQFHNSGAPGTFELSTVIVGVDDIVAADAVTILSDSSTLNSAFLVNLPEPGAVPLLLSSLAAIFAVRFRNRI